MKLLLVLLILAAVLCMASPAPAAAKRPLELADMFKFKRVADPQIGPDGKLIVYSVTSADLEGNKTAACLWLAPTAPGTEPRQLTNVPGKKDRHPRWSPDGKVILFESNRSGSMQLWYIALDGGEAQQLTSISTEASTGIWSPDGKSIAFVSAVYPEYSTKPFKESDEANKKKAEEIEKNPVKAKVFNRLFFRHWDSYVEDKRQHLFVIPWVGGKGGEPKDVTPGDRDAYPTSSTFSLGDDFTFSPDGQYLLFSAVPEKDEAWSTNMDICRVPITGGSKKWENLTKDNKAADGAPLFSPDGKYLAFRAQKRAGYEADKWELMRVEVNRDGTFKEKPTSLTVDLDRSVESFVWVGGSKGLVFNCEEDASSALYKLTWARGVNHAHVVKPGNGTLGSLSVSDDGKWLACTQARMTQPPEVCVCSLTEEQPAVRNVSHVNAALLGELDVPRPESVKVKVEGADMQMWVLKPPGFDPKKKWPVAYLVHGGPQGAWEDGWSFRWAPSLWAAQGYVVVLPNPRGSTSFGQKFVDEISGDWGGKCYVDLMAGLKHLEDQPWIDKDRMGAAGASFGGYMMNWFAVNTGRFRCLITHCSVWNFESMYATTDELWFDEWEHGGPPWGKNRESYEKHSPHRKAGNLGKFKTPMLIVHNDNDFRCPIGQGLELFSSLQRQGVPSRFVNFPDEGHWVLKPRNSEFWHKEVFAWLKKHVPPGGR